MAGELRTQEELEAEFEPNQQQAIGAQNHQNLIASTMGVSISGAGEPEVFSGISPHSLATLASVKGGVNASLVSVAGITVPDHGDGFYLIIFQLELTADKITNITTEITLNGAGSGFKLTESFEKDVSNTLSLIGGLPLVAGDVVSIETTSSVPTAVITETVNSAILSRQ